MGVYLNSPKSQSNNLKLISDNITNNPYVTEIKGQINNNINQEFPFAEVEFILYDASGNKVGNAEYNCGNLKPRAIWNCDAIGALANARIFKVLQLIGKSMFYGFRIPTNCI
jgi:hypothetical protein